MRTIGWILVIASSLWQISIHAHHPDMTETRILLTFWWQQLAQIGLVLFGAMLICVADARRAEWEERKRRARQRAMRGESSRY